MGLLRKFIKPVYAHCDFPCGIYDTNALTQAAATCLRMIEKIEGLPEDMGEKSADHNNYIRAVLIKEKHAQLCKDQLYMLWSDYFKPEHLEKFPNLHETIWQAAKQCGKVKQTVSREEAEKLVHMVADIAKMFAESKAA
jgi:nickel superoxide dismutase